jgi:acyl transferase domain-containing protein/acyl-CoA synthetase (AMP-forming)/AMP-acid ligase II/acyl carrier protein/short-subunit dehydrogenase
LTRPIPKTILTLPELLYSAAANVADKSIIFLTQDNKEVILSYEKLSIEARRILTGLRQQDCRPKDKIILLLKDDRDLIAAFWGCILGGYIPLILEVPDTYKESNPALDKLRHIWQFLDEPLIITDVRFELDYNCVKVDRLLQYDPDSNYYIPQPEDIAFLTLSSGSTGTPKCIQLTHQNILSRARGANKINRHSCDDIILNWLPFDHIGSISDWHIRCILAQCSAIYARKESILSRPIDWLSLIHKYRITHSWSPNFAYHFIVKELQDIRENNWDLSCVKFLLTAGESIDAKTIREFTNKLAEYGFLETAIRPAFGMAELGSGITYYQPTKTAPLKFHYLDKTKLTGKIVKVNNNHSDAICFADLGKAIVGIQMRIVDDNNCVLAEEIIGRLQVKGEAVFTGYYRNEAANREAFTEDGWFDTGDLGFLTQGHLVLAGRAKDAIIINGTNYYCQEIEAVVEGIEGIEISHTAACSVVLEGSSRERLAIFFCCRDGEDAKLLREIRRRVLMKVGVNPDYLIPVAEERIPKTGIGKIQRQKLSRDFAVGEFQDIVTRVANILKVDRIPAKTDLERDIALIWQNILDLETVGRQDNFFELGGNSLLLLQLQARLETKFDCRLTIADLFQYPTVAQQSAYFSRKESITQTTPQKNKTTGGDIAIIGMACRFPDADNIEQFWDNLCGGVESISRFSKEDTIAAGVSATIVDRPNYIRARPILNNIEDFDAEFFGYNPKEAELIDPQQRLLLECAWEGLEDAACNPYNYEGKIAIYAGAVLNTYLLNNIYPQRHRLDINDDMNVATLDSLGGFQMMVASDKDYLTTRISYKLNLTGASVNVQTACSTSLAAIHLAKQSLLQGECDIALAGGVSVQVPQKTGYLHQQGTIVSADGHCRAFSHNANGTVFGNGAGIVVLKRLADAVADGDRIYATIKGSAMNNDGSMKVGFLAPNGEGQGRVTAEAIADAGICAESISYVEAHGTGTILGDPIEISGLSLGFRQTTLKKQFCALGSVKTNVGHLQIASGIVGFIKTTLSLYHKRIPPTLNFDAPNPQIDFENSPFYVNTTLQNWEAGEFPRRASINSLGIGGTNVHVVLEEMGRWGDGERGRLGGFHLLALSAKSEKALESLIQKYLTFLTANPDVDLSSLCHTANKGRIHFNYRRSIVTNSISDLQQQLNTCIETRKNSHNNHFSNYTQNNTVDRLVFCFAGQGSQYPKMGQELYETQSVFREAIDNCAAILQSYLDVSLLDIIYDRPDLLNHTTHTQVAVFAIEYALSQLWQSWGIFPSAAIGHSLGEYVAATVAGVFSLADGLKLVAMRSKLMGSLPQGSMVAVFAPLSIVREIIANYSDGIGIAAINGDKNIVISGNPQIVTTIMADLAARGIATKQLNVSHAFHSPMMQPIIAEFRNMAESVDYNLPNIPIVTNLTGEISDTEIATAEYWCRHLQQPVRFADGMATLRRQGYKVFIECSPQPILMAMARSLDCETEIWLPSLRRGGRDRQEILQSIGGFYQIGGTIDWKEFDRDYSYQKLSLPTYPFQRQRYWIERQEVLPQSNSIHKGKGFNTEEITPTSLLGKRLLSPLKEIIFQTHIDTTQLSFLGDHRVNNAIVFPATAYIEMVLAAAREIWKTARITIKDIVIAKALILHSDVETTLQLIFSNKEKTASFTIYSLQEDESWQLHCQGNLDRNITKPTQIDINSLQQQFTESSIDSSQHYRDCRVRGLEYGETFQGADIIYSREAEALGKIAMPELLIQYKANYSCHPALLDSCLQVVFPAFPESSCGCTYLPIAIDSLSFHKKPTANLWSHVKVRSTTDTNPDIIKADIDIYDDRGNIVITIAGLTSKKAKVDRLDTPDKNWYDWLYEIEWINLPPKIDTARQNEGSWLILNRDDDRSQQLVEFLQAKRQKCYTIDLNQDNIATVSTYIQNDTSSPQGIIYLAGLETTAIDTYLQIECTNILNLIQTLIKPKFNQPPRLWLLTQSNTPNIPTKPQINPQQNCLWGIGKTIALEHPEFNCTCIDIDSQTSIETLGVEIIAPDIETQIALYQNQRYAARLKRSHKNYFLPQPLQLKITQRGSLDNLQWQPSQRISPQDNEIEIKIRSIGLNFRDLLNVLDLYPEKGALGMECVGEIVAIGNNVTNYQIGDAVIAITPNCFREYITVNTAFILPKPSHLTFTEAATMAGTFLTAYYTLSQIGRLRSGDRVLIHAAAGGVGLAAIQIAQRVGAEIFATASPQKWEYLRSLGVKYVFNSRNLDFSTEIDRITQGKGVDVILNSLAGEFIPKSISILNDRGRFIEIGKQKIWNREQFAQIKPNASYHIVDLLQTCQQQPEIIPSILTESLRQYQPLPYQIFNADRVTDAFRYMQQAKQIGRIVIEFPSTTIKTDATYLITGGWGDLGLKVMQWLIEEGAKNIVLLGRSEINSEKNAIIQSLQQKGANITTFTLNIADRTQLQQIFTEIKNSLPPLRGIIHCAGIIEDGTLKNQSWDSFDRVFQGKLQGAWNLHQITSNLDLDFFILFSSIASLFGSPAQANYTAANAFLDALAHNRDRMGLPATTINWGAWSKIGMASRQQNRELGIRGINSIEPDTAIEILSQFLHRMPTQIGVAAIDWHKFNPNFDRSTFFAEFSDDRETQIETIPDNDKSQILAKVRRDVAFILGIKDMETIEVDRGFTDLGMDSLNSLELVAKLQHSFNYKLPSTLPFDRPNITSIVDYLSEKLLPEPLATVETTIENVTRTIQELSEEEAEFLLLTELEGLQM